MNNGEDNIQSLDTYLRDIALWNERMERQRLGIIGQVQRALDKLACDVETINSRTPIKIVLGAPEFAEALSKLQLRYDGEMPRKPRKSPSESRTSFREYYDSVKPGECLVRQDFVALTGHHPTMFDRYCKEMVDMVKVSKGKWRRP